MQHLNLDSLTDPKQLIPPPHWAPILELVEGACEPINGLSQAQLTLTVELLQRHWKELPYAGQWDPETKVRHIRPCEVPHWKLPHAIQVHGSDVYVWNKGGSSKPRGVGFLKTVRGGVRLNDLRPLVQGNIKLRDVPKLLSEAEVRELTKRELGCQARLGHHAETVQVLFSAIYRAKPTKGLYEKISIVMEDCSLGELYELTNDLENHEAGRLLTHSLGNTLQLIRDALAMLDALESEGVLHRDIKPENLFLKRGSNNELRLKLGDFGLAQTREAELSRLARTGAMPGGSIEFACPDLVWTAHTVKDRKSEDLDRMCSPKTDVWSMGVVLYEILFGDLPNFGTDPSIPNCFSQADLELGFEDRMQKEACFESLEFDDVSREFLFGLIKSMLQLDPQKRRLGSELLQEFDDWKKALPSGHIAAIDLQLLAL